MHGTGSASSIACSLHVRTAREGIGQMMCYSQLPAEGFYAAFGFLRDIPSASKLQGDIPLPSVIMGRKLWSVPFAGSDEISPQAVSSLSLTQIPFSNTNSIGPQLCCASNTS